MNRYKILIEVVAKDIKDAIKNKDKGEIKYVEFGEKVEPVGFNKKSIK